MRQPDDRGSVRRPVGDQQVGGDKRPDQRLRRRRLAELGSRHPALDDQPLVSRIDPDNCRQHLVQGVAGRSRQPGEFLVGAPAQGALQAAKLVIIGKA